jgi:hypothetical protein
MFLPRSVPQVRLLTHFAGYGSLKIHGFSLFGVAVFRVSFP